MKKKVLFFALIISMVVGLLAFVRIYSLSPSLASNDSAGLPAPILWQEQPEKATAQNSVGSFSVRAIVSRPNGIVFFYAVKAKHGSGLSVSFLPDANLKKSLTTYTIPKVNTIQTLGVLGDYDVGVIHSGWVNQPGQILTLQASEGVNNTWVTMPVVQGAGTSNVTFSAYVNITNRNAAPVDVAWDVTGPITLAKISIKNEIEGQAIDSTLFTTMNSLMNVTVITKAEYDTLLAANTIKHN